MAERRALVPALQALQRDLPAMPIGAKNRIAARLAVEQRRRAVGPARRWFPMLSFVAGAALVLAVVGWRVLLPSASTPEQARRDAMLGAFAIVGGDCSHRPEGDLTALRGECRLVSPRLDVRTWTATTLAPTDDGVRLGTGEATFDVAAVAPGDRPVTILVSHGSIEVLGTRFSIEQDQRGGHVDLFEGRIRFVPSDPSRPVVQVQPGQRHAWGDRELLATPPPVPPPSAEVPEIVVEDPPPQPSRPTSRTGSDAEASAIAETVTRLRAAGRHGEAARTLRKALRRRWEPRTAQVLSYELGEILERHLGDPAQACRHWLAHRRKFDGGRYADAVQRSIDALSCE